MADSKIDVKQDVSPASGRAAELRRPFRDEFHRLFDRFANFSPWPLAAWERPLPAVSSWFSAPMPTVDVTEDDKAYTVTAELPGLAAEDVDVSVKGANLVIKGEKQQETKKEEKNYHLSERSYGMFERSFYLPEGVDREHINAEVAKGVLTVTLPKTDAAQTQAKKIEVKAA